MPDWGLGLNLDLPDPPQEPEGWFEDVERIVAFLAELHAASGRAFVIGIRDNLRGFSEDLYTVAGVPPDITLLRQIIGVGGG